MSSIIVPLASEAIDMEQTSKADLVPRRLTSTVLFTMKTIT